MRYLSICSGIEAASAAWGPLGWQPVGFSEIDRFASAVLKHRHPTVPNFGDMLGYRSWQVPPFGILVGGPPCQAFSVSGLRQGLADPRGQLSLTYCDLADHFDPRYTLWENVPGVLSDRTNPFGCLLGRLCGAPAALQPAEGHRWPRYGVVSGPSRTLAWRVLDAQYFGLAQRRERVFLLAARGSRNWRAPAALFPVSESVPRDTPPSRPAGQGFTYDLALCLTASGRGFERTGDTRGQDCVVPVVAACLTARDGKGPDSDTKPGHLIPVCFRVNGNGEAYSTGETTGALTVGYDKTAHTLLTFEGVRRLSATECERLMGFPDGHTRVPYPVKPATDSPRYKAIGNSMAVNVMRWIAERILFAESIMPLCDCGDVKLGNPPLCPICG